MKLRNTSITLFVLALLPMMVAAQVAFLDKPVSLQSGKMSLKAFLTTISSQTECVFSYDPIKINDKQMISVEACTKLRMLSALQKELPAYIQIKIHGKYVVLQKKAELDLKLKTNAAPALKMQPATPLPDYPTTQNDSIATIVTPQTETIITKDSTPVAVELQPNKLEKEAKTLQTETITNDTIQNKREPESTISLSTNDKPKTTETTAEIKLPPYSISDFLRKDLVCQLEFAGFNSMGALSLRLGAKNIYAIISAGGLANNYNFGGLGLGVQAQVYKKFGMNVELLRHRISSGAAFNVGVRGTVGQLRGELNYSFNKTLSVFAGPSLVLITTSYYRAPITTNAESTNISLGRSLQLGLIAGVRMNIPAIFYPKK